ncbi:crossover junction endodeoxyribonuclease RuvC [Candidatus Parcubacteria bacterium]|nr:crossover junction endodeoxyribonuclease RuvC [Candidatus Parcubacteria bacterium]
MKSKKSIQMPSKSSSRTIGIDPGFDRCGVAILEGTKSKQTLLFSTCIMTDKKQAHEDRLLTLGSELASIIKKWKPESLATEKLFFNINVRTGIKVAEARGVILYEAARARLDVYEYSPQDVKIAVTGYGKADKRQVEDMTLRILGMKQAPKYDDETDAIALCITHLASA